MQISGFIDILGFEETFHIYSLGLVSPRKKDGKFVSNIGK